MPNNQYYKGSQNQSYKGCQNQKFKVNFIQSEKFKVNFIQSEKSILTGILNIVTSKDILNVFY